jgi:hypothetical protein
MSGDWLFRVADGVADCAIEDIVSTKMVVRVSGVM